MRLLQEGQIIRGTYEVERFLGEGAFAEVFRVRHRFLGRQALKIFKTVGLTVGEIEVMLGEAIILSQLGHPNIIRVYDANTTETSLGTFGFFTMEYVGGGSLEQFWKSHGAQFVPVKSAVEIIQQICQGLAVAHDESPPIIHRDIKPQNILVGYDAGGLRARLSDFGLAKRVNPLTMFASARGTLAFKPPEAFAQQPKDSAAGDVWALGSTLYLMLTDRLPYGQIGDFDSADYTRFSEPLIVPSRLNVQVDPGLDQIVFRALSIDAAKRYANARALLEALNRWKPRTGPAEKTAVLGESDSQKSALGPQASLDLAKAKTMAEKALRLARDGGRLSEAADLMEEAFNLSPDLRAKYENLVKAWRRGIAM